KVIKHFDHRAAFDKSLFGLVLRKDFQGQVAEPARSLYHQVLGFSTVFSEQPTAITDRHRYCNLPQVGAIDNHLFSFVGINQSSHLSGAMSSQSKLRL